MINPQRSGLANKFDSFGNNRDHCQSFVGLTAMVALTSSIQSTRNGMIQWSGRSVDRLIPLLLLTDFGLNAVKIRVNRCDFERDLA